MSYIYTFVRQDISTEQQIVQIGHACHEAGKRSRDHHVSTLVLLGAEDEDDLIAIKRELDTAGIDHYAFYEPDFQMGYSAICTRPITDRAEREFFRRWRLLRHAA